MDIEIQYSKSMDKLAKSLIHKKFKKHLGSNASPLIPAEESSNEQAVIQANERYM